MAETIGGKSRAVALTGILALFATGTLFTGLIPTLDILAKHFIAVPFETIMLANTITGILAVPFSILGGAFANKVGYKTLAITGIVIAVAGGVYPFFLAGTENFFWIILSRAIVGVGLGLVSPLGGAMVISLFSGQKMAFYLGIGNVAFNLASIVYQTLGGYLALIGWNYAFLFYLAGLIPLALVLFCLPKTGAADVSSARGAVRQEGDGGAKEHKGQSGAKESLPIVVYGYIFLILLIAMICCATPFMTSTMLAERAIGDSAVAGMVTNVWAIGGTLAGLIFAAALKALKKSLYPALCLVGAIGFFIMYIAQNAYLYALAVFIVSISHFMLFVGFQTAAGAAAPKAKAGLVNGLVMASMNMGTFFCGYYLSIAQKAFPGLGTAAPFVSGAVGLLVLMAALLFTRLLNGRRTKDS